MTIMNLLIPEGASGSNKVRMAGVNSNHYVKEVSPTVKEDSEEVPKQLMLFSLGILKTFNQGNLVKQERYINVKEILSVHNDGCNENV